MKAGRIVRLDELTMPQRRLVLALVDAAKSSPEKMIAPDVSETSSEAIESEVRHDRATTD